MDTNGSVHPHAFPGFAPPPHTCGAKSGRGMLCLSPPHPPRRAPHHDGASCGRLRALPFSLTAFPGDCRVSHRHTLLYYTHRHDGHSLAPIIVPSWRSYTKRASNILNLTLNNPYSFTPNSSPRGEGSLFYYHIHYEIIISFAVRTHTEPDSNSRPCVDHHYAQGSYH